jgi:phage-related protein
VAVSDDEARPAFQTLVVATKDLTKAQDLLNIALDVSAATGTDLASVTDALAKGFAGNMKPLAALSPELKLLIKEGASLDEVLTVLQTNFGGAAVAAGNTAAGGMKKLGIAFDETKESIGEAFLPIMLKLQPVVEKFAAWAEKNPGLLAAVIAGMGILAVSILAVNAAMLLNPAVLITAGIVALGVAVVAAYKKFEGFRTVVRLVVNGILGYVETMVNGFIKGINIIIKGLNLVPGVSIKEIGNISLPGMGGEPGAAPGIHDSGLGMTQAPDLSSNDRGMGGMSGVNVIVNAGLVSTPAQVGQDIIAAIQKAQRASGQVFAPA